MGQKDLEMLGESVIKNPDTWTHILDMPVDELKELTAECKKRRPKTQKEFNDMRESLTGDNMNQTNTYLNLIREMIRNGDTTNDIYDKIIDKYPDIVEKKVVQFKGDKRRAIKQVKAQIQSVLYYHKGTSFTVDKTQHPYRYSFIDTGTETINMPDGMEISSIVDDGASIGHSTSSEIITWIVSNIPMLLNGERLEIERTSSGWYVRIMRR